MSTAVARVVFRRAKYLRLARKVTWPGPACSMPATPEISRSGGPSRRQFNFWASSESFMKETPPANKKQVQESKVQEFRGKRKNKDNAEAQSRKAAQRTHGRSYSLKRRD